MIQPITLAGAALCFWVLYQRYRTTPRGQRKSTRQEKLKLAKVLIAGLLALMAITYSMRGLDHRLDGKTRDATLVERVVTFFAK
jgi:hypothetical protein